MNPLQAQETAREQEARYADLPPRILSSDLPSRLIVEQDTIEVTFVVVDTDDVVEVRVNGQREPIRPGPTVAIRKTLILRQESQRVRVEATDERGNRRERQFIVYYDPQGTLRERLKASEEAPPSAWSIYFALAQQRDTNPSNDLSLPISLPGVSDIEGTIPDDQQGDDRTLLNLGTVFRLGQFDGYAGLQNITYGKAINEGLQSTVLFTGGTYAFTQEPNRKDHLRLGAVFVDINVGGEDYALVSHLIASYRLPLPEKRRKRYHDFGLDLKAKTFAGERRQEVQFADIHWTYARQNNDRTASFQSKLLLGSESEGTPESQFDQLVETLQWRNMWNNKLVYDTTLRIQYRQFVSAEALIDQLYGGDKRVDSIVDWSQAFGYQWHPLWRVALELESRMDVSNRSPYVRYIYGLRLQGGF